MRKSRYISPERLARIAEEATYTTPDGRKGFSLKVWREQVKAWAGHELSPEEKAEKEERERVRELARREAEKQRKRTRKPSVRT